ncbi:MAG: hypothetical protein ACKO37_09020 [Vampirovibrionales bacterium]
MSTTLHKIQTVLWGSVAFAGFLAMFIQYVASMYLTSKVQLLLCIIPIKLILTFLVLRGVKKICHLEHSCLPWQDGIIFVMSLFWIGYFTLTTHTLQGMSFTFKMIDMFYLIPLSLHTLVQSCMEHLLTFPIVLWLYQWLKTPEASVLADFLAHAGIVCVLWYRDMCYLEAQRLVAPYSLKEGNILRK